MNKANLWVGGIATLTIGLIIGYLATGTTKNTPAANSATTNITDETNIPVPKTNMTAEADGLTIWQFPDKRALNPEIFGTPTNPKNIELLPLSMRDTNEEKTIFTTVNTPLMFSNKIKQTTGSIKISVNDLTAKDSPDSKDEATVDANFIGPDGSNFRVVLKKLIPVGPDHPFFGGVGTNVLMHGGTGIGTPLVDEEFSYITLWGLGDVYKNGELIDSKRIIHVMVSERTRDDNFKLGFGVANPDKLEIHLALPPQKGSPTGPINSPLPTGIILPNGKEQPFMHVNFYGDIKLVGNQFIK